MDDTERYVILADIHIGFEEHALSKGIFLGGAPTAVELANDVVSIVQEYDAGTVILLGDIKSTTSQISNNEWRAIPSFLEAVSRAADIIIVPGNHDGNISRLAPPQITLTASAGLIIGNTLLTHGHTMPPDTFSHIDTIIMGHVHPIFFSTDSILNGQLVWVHLRTQKEKIFPSRTGDLNITILPAFNRYLALGRSGHRRKSISPIISRIKQPSSARVVTLDGAILGGRELLDCVL